MLYRFHSSFFATLVALLMAPAAYSYAPPICPHANEINDDILKWAKNAPWAKVLYITSIPVYKDMGVKVFYRPWDQSSGPDGNPKVGGVKMGQDVLSRLKLIKPEQWPDAISFQNEFNDVSPEVAKAFCDYYDTLRAGGYKGLIVYGSYGPGGPTDMTEWARPHIREACMKADAIETHEYWDLTISFYDTWLAHRHVRSMQNYPYLAGKPWFIGEFGSDRTSQIQDQQKRSGWRDRGKLSPEDYIKQIEIYRHGDPTEKIPTCTDNVIAVFIYQQGSPGWANYETMGTPLEKYLQTTWTPTVGYICGKVTDASGKPVEGAQVKTLDGSRSATTDQAGRYWLFTLTAGESAVSVTKENMKTQSVNVSVKAGDYLTRDFTLAGE